MPFLRLTRDRRGYENTLLLHTPHHGDRPRVLYWYRTAPGVRVGRPPLDEDAIRTIEEQHPDVDFNWSEILAVGAVSNIEVEPALPPRRRSGKPPRERERGVDAGRRRAPEPPPTPAEEPPAMSPVDAEPEPVADSPAEPAPAGHDLLEELVGREIATRLHARYAELGARISEMAGDPAVREAWHARAEALNPDLWVTPDEILAGVQRADALFDQIRRDLLAAGGD